MDEKMLAQLVKELFESVTELHEEYSDNNMSYAIDAEKNDNVLNITVTVKDNKDKKDFEKFVDSLDDDVYEEVIESLQDEIGDLTKLYDTEAYKDVIKVFKNKVKEVAQDRINYLKTLI